MYKGIQLILAGSFSQTYKRNAINNGFLVIEASELLKDIKDQYGEDKLSVRTSIETVIDFQSSVILANSKKYPINPVGEAAQELIISKGLENWVKNRIK